MIRIQALQHASHEDLAQIEDWARAHGHAVGYTRFQLGETPPALEDWDWLIVLGGPMNIYQYDAYPWLRAEREYLGRAIAAGKQVIGLCLGAQLLADALGAPTTQGVNQEIGWHEVELLAKPEPWFAGFPDRALPFHWHGDTFRIPDGAVRVARSAACANQGFTWGKNVCALQFHLEVTRDTVERWTEVAARDGLPDAPYVQPFAAMRAHPERCVASNRLMTLLLDNLARAWRG